MADNGNREPTDTFRRAGGKRRREPPIIDASATEVPAEPASPVAVPEETVSSEPAEPVLFGSAMRDPTQRTREVASEAPSSDLSRSDETGAEMPAVSSGPGVESEAVPPAASPASSEPEIPLAAFSASSPWFCSAPSLGCS